jgi:hypothetical protein
MVFAPKSLVNSSDELLDSSQEHVTSRSSRGKIVMADTNVLDMFIAIFKSL